MCDDNDFRFVCSYGGQVQGASKQPTDGPPPHHAHAGSLLHFPPFRPAQTPSMLQIFKVMQILDVSSHCWSGQATVPAWENPLAHVSTPLQKSASSQSESTEHSKQASVSVSQPNSHSAGLPAWHPNTASQTSVPAQKLPLLQRESVGVLIQLSVVSSHVSTVQATPSSQGCQVRRFPYCKSQRRCRKHHHHSRHPRCIL